MYICSGIDIQYIIKYNHIRRILLDQDYMPLHALFLITYTQGHSQVEYENVFFTILRVKLPLSLHLMLLAINGYYNSSEISIMLQFSIITV